ncbi:MAG: hypothetical protein F4Y58_02380 [Gammaproteobacteria bacterium]|nr:hypothetical protein [Gammaproteobacteria bacterium]
MKFTRINQFALYLVLLICMLSNGSTDAETAEQFTPSATQAEEINERMNLYKRIRHEQNKKALMQLLHDIADIQKQCRDKGYLCNTENTDISNPSFTNLHRPQPQAENVETASPPNRIVAPELNLIGIVGNRARFRLEDGRIRDFSLGESVADSWKLAEITAATALLIHDLQPEIKARYRIYKEAHRSATRADRDTTERIP